MSTVEQIFENYVKQLKLLSTLPDLEISNEKKLQLYALYSFVDDPSSLKFSYKQSTVGPCLAPSPSFFDLKGRHKHNAWSSLGAINRIEAMVEYIELVHDLLNHEITYSGHEEDNFQNIVNQVNNQYENYQAVLQEEQSQSEALNER